MADMLSQAPNDFLTDHYTRVGGMFKLGKTLMVKATLVKLPEGNLLLLI